MLISTTIYIIIAFFIALAIAFFFNRNNNSSSKLVKYSLLLLRTFALFLILLLFLNPKITNKTIETIKPNLIVLTDNSSSIKINKSNIKIKNFRDKLIGNTALKNKYTIKEFAFSSNVEELDSLTFNNNTTNIFNAINKVDKMFKKDQNAMVILTDGIQTNGRDYEYLKTKSNLFPVVFGDTTLYEDVSIAQLNVNKYAYLRHKFPVEVFLNYQGNRNRNLNFKVLEKNKVVFFKNIPLSKEKNSDKIDFYLPANKVGYSNYKAVISSVKNEKNKRNNTKNFTVEVIDEQAEIAIVSSIKHPDVGVLKRAIETNKQRKVSIIDPLKFTNIRKYALVIVYQPNANFEEVFKQIKQNNSNVLMITGTQTNWEFLNNAQKYFSKKAIHKSESYFGSINTNFTTFYVNDIGFNDFSPLQDFYGDVSFNNEMETILNQKINKIETNQPLIGIIKNENQKIGFIFGEGLYKWNMSSYVQNNSKENFNEFINSIVQYLSLNKKNNRLEIEAKPLYYESDNKTILATYYDANFNASTKQTLWIEVVNKSTKEKLKYPLMVEFDKYKITLNSMKQGDYNAVVFDPQNKVRKAINFTVLPYTLEEQLVRSDIKKMQLLAQNNETKLYFSSQNNAIKKALLEEKELKNIQKEKITKKPFIQLHWILSMLIILLTIEWFIRKYNGLI